MKQSIKTRLLLFFVCVLVVLMPLGIFGSKYVVKAAEVNESKIEAFVTAVQELEKDAYDDTLLLDAEYLASLRTARSAEQKLGTAERNDDRVIAAYVIYNSAYAIFEAPLALDVEITKVVVLFEAQNIAWADKDLIDKTEETYETLVGARPNVKTFLENNTMNGSAYITALETDEDDVYVLAYKASKQNVDDAVTAVNNIYKNAESKVVLNSEESIRNAKTALEKVNAKDLTSGNLVVESVNYTETYNNAVSALKAWKDKAQGVATFIQQASALYSETEGAEVTYSIKDKIRAAETGYNGLEEDADNDVKKYLRDNFSQDYANLQTMVARLNNIENTVIPAVEEKITAIGTVVWTDECSDKIYVDAKGALDELDKDIKDANYSAISNYADYTKADQDYQALGQAIDDTKAAIANIQTVYDAEGDWDGALTTAEMLYNKLTPLQKAAVTNKSKLNDWGIMRNAKDSAVEEFRALVDAIGSDISDIVANQDCKDKIVAAESYYTNTMVANNYSQFVSAENDLLVAFRDEFDRQSEEIKPWLDAMDVLDTTISGDVANITYANWDKVYAAETIYTNLSSDDKEKADTFTGEKTLYTNALNKRDELVKVITDLAKSMNDLANAELYNFTDDQSAVYVALGSQAYIDKVGEVTADYDELKEVTGSEVALAYLESLSNGDQGYVATYVDCLTDYANALIRVEALKVEQAINAILANTVDYLDEIGDALSARKAFLDKEYDGTLIRNSSALDTASQALDATKKLMTKWVSDVRAFIANATGETDAEKVASLVNIDMTALKALYNQYKDDQIFTDAMRNYASEGLTESGDTSDIDVPNAYALLESIVKRSNEVVSALENDINNIPDPLKMSDVDTVDKLMNRYLSLGAGQAKGDVGLVLSDATVAEGVDNAIYGALELAYSKLLFANNFDQAVAMICAEINAGNKTLANYAVAQTLKSVYASASSELKDLVSANSVTGLDEVIASYDQNSLVDVNEIISQIIPADFDPATYFDTQDNDYAFATLTDAVKELFTKIDSLNEKLDLTKENNAIVSKINELISAEIAKLVNTNTEGGATVGTVGQIILDLDEIYNGEDGKLDLLIATVNGLTNTDGTGVVDVLVTKLNLGAEGNEIVAKINELIAASIADGGSIDELFDTVNGEIEKLVKALDKLTNTDGTGVVDVLVTKLNLGAEGNEIVAKINELIAASIADGGSIDELFDTVNATVESLTEIVEDLDSAYKAADAQLNSRIDELQKTVIIITAVFAVAIAASLACIIVLFFKKKNN